MDPMIVARLAAAWADELVGASLAGARPAADGVELVFDRPPDGARPGARSALHVRLGTPTWAWTGPLPGGERAAPPWAWRPATPAALRALAAPGGDRGLALAFDALTVHVELWPPGNVIVTDPGRRIAWCARTRAASSFRAALAAGQTYAPPAAPTARPFAHGGEAALAAWLVAAPADPGERLARLARDFAGLPRGLLEALAPTLPRRALAPGALDTTAAAALARELIAWSEATYAAAPPVRAYAWAWPSPGATLLTRALVVGEGPRFVGSYGSWSEAAREAARALPAPVDAARVAAARAAVRRLERAQEAVRAEIADAARAADVRADATALAAFLPRVARGAASATVPDPADPARTRTVALDPALKPHENVDRLFARAGKLERVAAQAPARLAELVEETARARAELAAAERGELPAGGPPRRGRGGSPSAGGGGAAAPSAPARRKKEAVPSALQPRKFRTREGWEVWIGKSNQGNDHLTHRLARSEDLWMHVHGAAGSHVVLRRGKGPNEPSKATLEEVAGWAAFYSQARNAGTVPVTVTQKKYVSKPRKAPAGLALVTRAKTVFARPTEPPEEARVDNEES